MVRVLALVVLLVGCVSPSEISCGDGRVCPAGTQCDTANHQCVQGDQLTTCVGMDDGADCLIDGSGKGICSAAVCIAVRCGDGYVRGSERCDGTNLDGKSTCKDLGFYNDAPIACSNDCVYDTSMCADFCGDDMVNGPEFCEPGQPQLAVSCLDFGFDLGLVGCTGACQPDFSTCARFGFAPTVTGSNVFLYGVWGSGPNDVFLVGSGKMVHWDGSNWNEQASGSVLTNFADAWGSSPTNVWAVGSEGTVAHYTNGTWTSSVAAAASDTLTTVWGSSANDVYAAGYNGTVIHYNGTAWSSVATGSGTGPTYRAITGSGPNDVVVVGQDAIAVYDGGWTPDVLSGDFGAAGGLSATDLWIAGASNTTGPHVMHRTSATGQFNEVLPISWATSIHALWENDPTKVFFATQQDVAIGNGTRYLRIHSSPLVDLWGSGPADVWGVTASGGVRHFTGTAWVEDGNTTAVVDRVTGTSETNMYASNGVNFEEWDGEHWVPRLGAGVPPNATYGLWAAAKDDVFQVGPNGAINRWNGSSWASVFPGISPTTETLNAIWGRTTTDIWAVGDNGTVVHYNGSNWSATQLAAPTAAMTGVWGSGANDVYASGFVPGTPLPTAVMFHYTGTWTQVTIPTLPVLYDLWGSGPNDVYASSVGSLLHWDGTAWSVIDLGSDLPLFGVGGSGPHDVFTVGSLGTIFHYDGTTWAPMRSRTEMVLYRVFALPTRVGFAGDSGTAVLMRTVPP